MPDTQSFHEIPHPKKAAFLAAVEKTGNITAAAKMAKVDRGSHYDWQKNDPDYPEEFRRAMEVATDLLETEARRRAVTGTLKPIFQGGKRVGIVREYSDTLLIFLMKGARPEKYRDQKVEHVGAGGGAIKTEDVTPGAVGGDTARLARALVLLDRARERRDRESADGEPAEL